MSYIVHTAILQIYLPRACMCVFVTR